MSNPIDSARFLMCCGKGGPVRDNSDGVQTERLLFCNNSGDLVAGSRILPDYGLLPKKLGSLKNL
jgi:hypothetical protein